MVIERKKYGALGWNIQIYHTVLAYSPPGDGPVAFQGWHQDSDRVNHEIESIPRPRISVKIAHFLTDCTDEGRANFWVVPGSHLMDTYAIPDNGALPAGAELWGDVTEASLAGGGTQTLRPGVPTQYRETRRR